jgi:hypothetical protein
MLASSQVLLCCLINKVGDWTIRIDPPHGNSSHSRKHVHVSKRGLKGEYSWNLDGSRHDEHRFPTSDQCIRAAKEHAASALGIPPNSLSLIVGIPGSARISVRALRVAEVTYYPVFNSYIRRDQSVVFFGSPLGLVTVLYADA